MDRNVEKLRKALEKKAESFQLEKQNAADVVNVFSEREQKPSVFLNTQCSRS